LDLSQIVSLAKRRGFIFQSSEIYGGINSCWDYGPLGVELKNNIKQLWWKAMTKRQDIVGLDSSILMHSKVWAASGHIDNFTDPLVDCKACKQRFRQDKIVSKTCPACNGELTEPRLFNLMFKTFMGPLEDTANQVYLRPETAQGIYVNFLNVQSTMRLKIPFGIAQIGKAFRNEITPGNFIFRTREFEQMEMQYFIHPKDTNNWLEYFKELRLNYYISLGINKDNLRFHQHKGNELAHYAKDAYDIEYNFPIGWNEVEGIHHRGDFDLSRHQEYSGKNLHYNDEVNQEKYIPYIIETSAGCDRTLLMYLCEAYTDDKANERILLKLNKKLAPIKIAILPLMKKEELLKISNKCFNLLSSNTDYNIDTDVSGSIGKRYRRQDEIGTPYCITIDYDSINDMAVTVRERDSMNQERISIDNLINYFTVNL